MIVDWADKQREISLTEISRSQRLAGLFPIGINIYRSIQNNGLVYTLDVTWSLRKLFASSFLLPEEINESFIALSNSIASEVWSWISA